MFLGPIVTKLFNVTFANEQEILSLENLSILVKCLWVKAWTYPRV